MCSSGHLSYRPNSRSTNAGCSISPSSSTVIQCQPGPSEIRCSFPDPQCYFPWENLSKTPTLLRRRNGNDLGPHLCSITLAPRCCSPSTRFVFRVSMLPNIFVLMCLMIVLTNNPCVESVRRLSRRHIHALLGSKPCSSHGAGHNV